MSCNCDSQYIGRMGHNLLVYKSNAITPAYSAHPPGAPIIAGTIEVPCAFFNTEGESTIEWLRIVEKVDNAANIRTPSLRVHLMNAAPATAPTVGVPYNPEVDKWQCTILVETGYTTASDPFVKWRKGGPLISEAWCLPQIIAKGASSSTSLWFCVAADNAPYTPVSPTEIYVSFGIRRHR